MRLDVLSDHLIGHIPSADGEIAPRPQVASPILAAQLTKLLQQTSAGTSFQALHQHADCQMWRHRQQQMDVVTGDMPTHDVHLQGRTRLPDQFAQAHCDLSAQYRLAVFGDPDHMILQVVNRMRRFSVAHQPHRDQLVCHPADDNVRAGDLPSVRRSGRPARPLVKTACLKGRGF